MAATWIEERPLNLRWLLSASLFVGLLAAADLARVGLLVTVGQAGLHLAAELIHVPLGVLGFVACCAAAVLLLRLQPPAGLARAVEARRGARPPAWLAPVVCGCMLGHAAGLPRPRPLEAPAQPWRGAQLAAAPAQWNSEPAPMTALELKTHRGARPAKSAERRRFGSWNGLNSHCCW